MFRSNVRSTSGFLACILALATAARADTFVVDSHSVTWPNSSDILTDQGPAPPQVAVPASALGLQAGDEINAMSDGLDPIAEVSTDPVLVGQIQPGLLFSVHRQSTGAPGSGVNAERLSDSAPPAGGDPYGHPSDIFLHDGTPGTNSLAVAPHGWGTDNGDEAWAGLVNPASGPPPFPGDDVNAYERRSFRAVQGGVWGFGDDLPVAPVDPPQDPEDDKENWILNRPIFFSLRGGSPTLAAIGASEGDILVAGGIYGNTPSVFVDTPALGIPASADMDSLSLLVEADGFGNLFVRKARFTVRRTTTGFALNGVLVTSGADVIEFDGSTSELAYTAADMGLLPDDDIDALEGITIQNGATIDVVAIGAAQVSTRVDAFAVTQIGDSGQDGVRVDLPSALSFGATFAVDGEFGDGDSLTVESLGRSVVDSGIDGAHLGFVRVEPQVGKTRITASYARANALRVEVLDGEQAVLVHHHTEGNFDLTVNSGVPLGVFSAYLDVVYDPAGMALVQELRFGGHEGEEFCVAGECASGNRVRITALCNNEVVEFAFTGFEATARGIAGFGVFDTNYASSALQDGRVFVAGGYARIDQDDDGLTVSGFTSTGDEGATISGWGRRGAEDEIDGAAEDGVTISLDAISLVKRSGISYPTLQVSAQLSSPPRGADDYNSSAWLSAIDEDTMAMSVRISPDWTAMPYDLRLAVFAGGTMVSEHPVMNGETLRFEGHARIVAVNISWEGYRFRLAEEIAVIDTRNGFFVAGDEFHVLHSNTELAGVGLSRVDIRATDLESIRIRRGPPRPRPTFRRGDANASGVVDLSDAVYTFSFLFLGGPEPTCFDAADSNDSGVLDISDGIRTLQALFLGFGSIPVPGPLTCGADPTPDDLSCDAYDSCE